MDSIVTQANDGFDKDGNFLNAQTELLPWPNKVIQTPRLGSSSRLNPYDESGGYITISTQNVAYYNADGTVKWVISNSDIYNSSMSLSWMAVIHIINGEPHLVGIATSSTNVLLYSINLDDLSIAKGTFFSTATLKPKVMGILNDDTLFLSGESYGNADIGIAQVIDVNTMTLGDQLIGCGYINSLKSSHSSITATRAYYGVSLFNGCLTYAGSSTGIFSSGGYSLDVSAVLWGINVNMDFSETSTKLAIRTNHCFANNRFGNLYQISKDLFVSYGDGNETGYWTFNQPNTMYFTRQELESWASNSIYASHSIRIPLTKSVLV